MYSVKIIIFEIVVIFYSETKKIVLSFDLELTNKTYIFKNQIMEVLYNRGCSHQCCHLFIEKLSRISISRRL